MDKQKKAGRYQRIYDQLSELLVKFYRAPASTSRIERNHKVGKRVLSQTRTRMAELSRQNQVAIANNNFQHRWSSSTSREHCVHAVILTYFDGLKCQSSQEPALSVPGTPESNTETVVEDEGDVLQWDEFSIMLETSLMDLQNPFDIPNGLIFGDI